MQRLTAIWWGFVLILLGASLAIVVGNTVLPEIFAGSCVVMERGKGQ